MIQVLRDMLMVWTRMEAEDRIGLEIESTELGHGLADGDDDDE